VKGAFVAVWFGLGLAPLPAAAFVARDVRTEERFWPAPTAQAAASADLTAQFERALPGRWALCVSSATGRLASGVRGVAPAGLPADRAAVLAAADAFRDRAAPLLGSDAVECERVRAEVVGGAWHVTWQQRAGLRPVVGAWLDLVLRQDGTVVAFASSLRPGLQVEAGLQTSESAAQAAAAWLGRPVRSAAAEAVVWPPLAAEPARAAWQLQLVGAPGERWRAVVDAGSGVVLALESGVRTEVAGSSSADVVPLYAQDAPVERPLPWLRVRLTDRTATLAAVCSADGTFRFDATPGTGDTVRAGLESPYLRVGNAAGDAPSVAAIAASPLVHLHFGAASGRLDERTIYVQAHRIHDYARTRFDFRGLDLPMPAIAGEPGLANAYWDGQGIHFGDGGGRFYNLGLFADVIYHEYTHAITDVMYRPFGGLNGTEGGAMHEGLSDYFACTLTNEPLVGENLFRDGSGAVLRNLDNSLVWPADARGEVHADGEIFAGALWNLRQSLGSEVSDALIHFARAFGPQTFDAYANAVLLEDDLLFGDGQASNGSPHRVAILAAFARHGIGPGTSGVRRLVHVPLADTEANGIGRIVRAGFEAHLSASTDSLVLAYSSGGGFTFAGMHHEPDGDFSGEIPGAVLGAGTTIHYYIRTTPRRGSPAATLPPGAPASTYVFRVGTDVTPPSITCDTAAELPVFAWPAALRARIRDNLGVAYACVETWQDGIPSATLGMQRDLVDPEQFTAQFANVGTLGTRFRYRIVAADAAHNANIACVPACDSTFETVLVARWQESFETTDGSFEHASVRPGFGDAWRRSTDEPATSHAWQCGSPAAEYAPGLAAALVTPEADLGTGAVAHVRSWIDTEPNGGAEAFDGAVVEVEIDADAVWRPLVPASGYTHIMAATGGTNVLEPGRPCLGGRDRAWRQLEFHLGAWAGHRVRLRFLFASDGTPSPFGYRGWILDDFDLDPGSRDPTDAPRSTAATRLLVSAPAPCPARGRVDFQLATVAREPLRITMYDARGRRVRTLWDGPAGRAAQVVAWDGNDQGGLALPAGVYYYRLDSRRGREQGRIVLVR
jgi:hypothetical protein